MKKFTLLVLTICTGFFGFAQMQTPAPSPGAKLEQMVGLTDVTVAYSRPSMKGRTVFGNLVPYGKLWRTGANGNTTINFSDDVIVGEKTLKAGTYAVFVKPDAKNWEVFFYTDTENWGTPAKWEEGKIAASITVPSVKTTPTAETFTISIDNLYNNGATLGIWWENTYAGVPFEVPTKAKAMKSIEAAMGGPTANDYFGAASYYYQEDMEIEKAKEYVDQAVALNPEAFWMMRQQSLIYAKMGDKDGAIAAAKKSLAAAEKAGNADYVKMNTDSLKEWGGM